MKRIRSFLAIIALLAALGGFSIQGMGSMANAANHHAGPSVASIHRYGPCPIQGIDC